MFTTEGATRSTALTTAREYSSKSAASAAPVAVSLREGRSELAWLNKNSSRAARSKFVVVIPRKFRLTSPFGQLQVDPIYTDHLEGCPPLVLGLKEGMAKTSAPPSVLEPQCPSRLVLDRIADKWTALVIQILARGTMRYAELQRAIGGISQKMLTQTLRSLERDGLVQRKVHPVVPPKVEYSLTRLGRTLIEPLHALCRWSEKHLAELQANRARAKAKAME
jgi:DNA-binding HxlR family transcriptional regulator